MTRDEVIRLAREAGICMDNSILLPAPDGEVEALDRFAALVAAHEREACAKLVEKDDSMRWSGAADAIRARSRDGN